MLPTILVIDDDRDLSGLLQSSLIDRAEVTVAGNWTDASAWITDKRFDLILLDLFLPDTEPLKPVEIIREIDPDYPIIIMSGNLDPADTIVDRAMQLGINTFLRKPFDFAAAVEKIMAYLS